MPVLFWSQIISARNKVDLIDHFNGFQSWNKISDLFKKERQLSVPSYSTKMFKSGTALIYNNIELPSKPRS